MTQPLESAEPVPAEPVPAGQPENPSAPGDQPDAAAPAPAGRKDKSRLLFGAGGLGIGLIAGLLLGQVELPAGSSAIADAVETCDVAAATGISLLDDGQSISMQTAGTESAGAGYADVTCVLTALEIPQSVMSRVGSTRALDGRQTGEWGSFSASWGYHPDNGLDIVVETVDGK